MTSLKFGLCAELGLSIGISKVELLSPDEGDNGVLNFTIRNNSLLINLVLGKTTQEFSSLDIMDGGFNTFPTKVSSGRDKLG